MTAYPTKRPVTFNLCTLMTSHTVQRVSNITFKGQTAPSPMEYLYILVMYEHARDSLHLSIRKGSPPREATVSTNNKQSLLHEERGETVRELTLVRLIKGTRRLQGGTLGRYIAINNSCIHVSLWGRGQTLRTALRYLQAVGSRPPTFRRGRQRGAAVDRP